MKHPVKYNNLAFRIVGSLAAAQFIVMYGVKQTFFELLHNPMYYLALIVSFIIALCVTGLVHVATKRLDKKYSWWDNPTVRSVFQFSFGFLPSAAAAAVLAWIYFTVMGVDIVKVGYFRMDYPAIVLMLFTFNMYYMIHYLVVTGRKRQELAIPNISDADDTHAVQQVPEIPDGDLFIEENTESDADETGLPNSLFVVYSGTENIFLDIEKDICMFYRANDFNWVITFDNKTYSISQSLNALEEEYCGDLFFKVNRKAIVHFNAVRGYEAGSYTGSLLIKLKEECLGSNPPDETLLTVSQEKARRFRDWMQR